MTTLYLIGALMALVATLFVALPLLRGQTQSAAPQQKEANLQIYADQLQELENDQKNGLITQDQFDHAKNELERRLLSDVAEDAAAGSAGTATSSTSADELEKLETAKKQGLINQKAYEAAKAEILKQQKQGARQAAPLAPQTKLAGILLSIVVPVVAIGTYFMLGNPDAIDATPPAMAVQNNEDAHQVQQIEAMLPDLQKHLAQNPDDAQAWTMLGRSLLVLQRFEDAAKAYERIAQLSPGSAQALADYADALGMAQGQKLAGKPTQVIEQALKIDPKNHKALYLAGFAAVETGDAKQGVKYWERLLAVLPPDQKGVDSLRAKVAELKQQAGMPAGEAPAAAPLPAASAGGPTLSGRASLSKALQAQVSPQDTVFIYARAANGPRMPLAMLRVQAKDLPMDFKLDESMGMSPQMKLSAFPEVVVVARVSKSGTAMTQPGDLEGSSQPVKLGTKNIKIEISRKVE